MHFILIAFIALSLFLTPSLATSQQPPQGQPATADAPITVTFESIRLTKTGFMATVSYVNTTTEPLQLTLTYPQEKSGFAADNLGNEYTLVNATGMERKDSDPNIDIKRSCCNPISVFLLAPPNKKANAGYQFKRTTEQPKDTTKDTTKPSSLSISIGLYARPAKDFKVEEEPQRAFSFTATITDTKPN